MNYKKCAQVTCNQSKKSEREKWKKIKTNDKIAGTIYHIRVLKLRILNTPNKLHKRCDEMDANNIHPDNQYI